MRINKKVNFWKNIQTKDWNDWHLHIRNRITSVEQLKKVVKIGEEHEKDIQQCLSKFRMAISPYYASLMDTDDSNCPIRMQAIPTIHETRIGLHDMNDPLHEDKDSPTPGLTHRYPDRVLFVITDQCSMYCRHCTRRRVTGITDMIRSKKDIAACIDYIRKTKIVRDVVISGGDPLTLGDEVLENIIKQLRAIKHVEIIRIGSRLPVVLPMRITKKLTNMLQKYHPIWLNTQFNHPKEITEDSARACDALSRAGIPLNNQSVLLKGINDCPHIMKRLVLDLLKIRVRPYYLYQCDLTFGIEHFRTSIGKGIELVERLRGYTSGFAVPTFVIDTPGGGGKVPLMPQYMISRSDKKIIVRNYEGMISAYTEPDKGESSCSKCGLCKSVFKEDKIGLARLFSGNAISIKPVDIAKGYELSSKGFHA